MGFKVERTNMRLVFEDPAMNGAEVVCRGVPLGVYLDLAKMKEQDGAEAAMDLFTVFADKVLSEWNLEEEDGTPLPATSEGMLSLEAGMVMKIINAWMSGVTSPPAPLVEPSTDTDMLAAASIPLATSSASP